MTDNVIPLRFNVQQVGKHVKGSKKRFTWQISLNSKQHIIILDFSFISGKVKVTVDRKILLQNQLPTNTSFQYPFTLNGNALNVIQQGDNFELRINNKVFSHLYNQMKTNKQFKKYQDQVKDFNTNENQFQAKKLTLNIGGVSGQGMKKKSKQQSFQQHNWNAFGAQQQSNFPNYFDNQSTLNTIQQKQQTKLNIIQKKQQTNIFDLQTQIQRPSKSLSNNKNTQKQQQYSTMQMMFSTLNMGNNNNNNKNNEVVIDNNQVDFFSQPQNNQTKQSNIGNNKIDFFGLESPVKSQPTTNMNQLNYETGLQNIFATTNNQNMGFDFNQSNNHNFSTNIQNVQNKPFNLQGFTLETPNINKPIPATNTNNNLTNFNLNDTSINQPISSQGFETTNLGMMQSLFATSSGTLSNNNTTNVSLNNNFSTGLNNNNQMQMTTLLSQQNVAAQQSAQQFDINQINMNDFSSIQMLFQTNNMGISQPSTNVNQNNIPMTLNISPLNQTSQLQQNNFSNNFSTGTGIISPNMMGMSTYSGGNLAFNINNDINQFSTSVNMNKNTPSFQKPTTKPTEDLI